MVKIEIEGTVYTVPTPVFRRLLTLSRPALDRCRAVEGSMFPKTDRDTFDLIGKLQYQHRSLL